VSMLASSSSPASSASSSAGTSGDGSWPAPPAALAYLSKEAATLVKEKRGLLESYLLLQEFIRELLAVLDAKAKLGAVMV
jgi:hypothetical protein